MKTISIRFYEELNDFLPVSRKKKQFEIIFTGTPSIKGIIESHGVPHTEVDLILVNGTSVRFSYKLKGYENISVYPEFESFDISGIQKLRLKPLRRPKFVLDVHLGTLARYMRMFGFDVNYKNDFSDSKIIDISINEKRAILTRDLGILKQGRVTRGYWVRNTKPVTQIEEIIERFHLKKEIKEFSRCIRCNTILKRIDKKKIINIIPPKVRACQNEFFFCYLCNKVYWKGTHYEKMSGLISKLKSP